MSENDSWSLMLTMQGSAASLHRPTKLRNDFSFQCTRSPGVSFIGISHQKKGRLDSFGLIVRVYEGIWYHCEDVKLEKERGELGI
jgi:hypothetical protein